MKKFVYILLLSAISFSLAAQDKQTGMVIANVWVPEGDWSINAEGAMVALYTPNDTLHAVTSFGRAVFSDVPAGKITLQASLMSYRNETAELTLKAGQTLKHSFYLKPAAEQLEASKVKAEITVLKISGDSLVYNVAGIQTMEGDEALKIVEQLPGVEASKTEVRVFGREIERTYIDGNLVFGSNPMAALLNLPANDVLKIRVYDEEVEKGPRRRRRDDKRQVMDIETKSKLIQATNGHFLASYGTDLDRSSVKTPHRYGAGATGNFFSENLLISGNVFFNNLNRRSNKISDIMDIRSPKPSYDRVGHIDVGIDKNWAFKSMEYDKIRLDAGYTFEDNYSHSENITQQEYYPSEDYGFRQYEDTTRHVSNSMSHQAKLNFSTPLSTKHSIYFKTSNNFRIEDKDSESYNAYGNRLDDLAPVSGNTSRTDVTRRYSLYDNVGLRIENFNFDVSFDASNSDGSGFRTDETTSTAARQELNSTSNGLSRKVDARAGFYHFFFKDPSSFNPYLTLDLEYRYILENSRRLQTTMDMTSIGSPVIDPVNTYNYTNNTNTHKSKIGLKYLLSESAKLTLTIDANFNSTGINRDERFPNEEIYSKRFNAFLPSIGIMNTTTLNRFSVSYMTSARVPSIEQLRPYLDNSNPYMLIAGNNLLKQTYTHMFHAEYSTAFLKSNTTLQAAVNISNSDNLIAPKRIFFSQPTELEQWNYTAPAQSTLTTYENISGAWTAKANVWIFTPLKFIKSTLKLSPAFEYANTPSFVNDYLNRTKSYTPNLGVEIKTNISRNLRFNVNSNTSYTYAYNSLGQVDRFVREGLTAGMNVANIFKLIYMNASYSLQYYTRFGENPYSYDDHILNLAVGCRLLKKRLDLSITAYDVLNENSAFTTRMYSDYVTNTWRQSFGRYVTFNIAYKFYHSKSGLKRNDLNDGSTGHKSGIFTVK